MTLESTILLCLIMILLTLFGFYMGYRTARREADVWDFDEEDEAGMYDIYNEAEACCQDFDDSGLSIPYRVRSDYASPVSSLLRPQAE